MVMRSLLMVSPYRSPIVPLLGQLTTVLYREVMYAAATSAPDMHTKKSASKSSGAMWRIKSICATLHRLRAEALSSPEGWHRLRSCESTARCEKTSGVEAAETRKSVAQEGR